MPHHCSLVHKLPQWACPLVLSMCNFGMKSNTSGSFHPCFKATWIWGSLSRYVKNIYVKLQWKLGIMRSLGPRNCVYIRYFVIYAVNKQYKTKEINSLRPEKSICYIRSFVISNLSIQWNLFITRSLGIMKITLLYQVSHYIRVKKQRNIKSWDQQNDLVIRGFCYIRPLYNEVPLYRVSTVHVNRRGAGGGGGGQLPVMSIMIIPIPHYENFWTIFWSRKKKKKSEKSVGSPPPPPPPPTQRLFQGAGAAVVRHFAPPPKQTPWRRPCM